MADLDIWVKRKHITQGQRGSSRFCPIALAVEEQHPEVGYPTVAGYWISDRMTRAGKAWTLPEQALEFVRRFDGETPKRELKPFKFTAKESLRM